MKKPISSPKSFKTFKCVWCGEEIPAGSDVIRHLRLWETDGQDWRMHGECRDACERDGTEDFTLYDNVRGRSSGDGLPTNGDRRPVPVPAQSRNETRA